MEQRLDLRAELLGEPVAHDGEQAQQVGVGAVARAEGSNLLVLLDELEERVGAVG